MLQYLPFVTHGNRRLRNVLARVKIDKASKQLYNYDIPEGMRPDHVATAYYRNPALDWLLYALNNRINPYYDFGVTDASVLERAIAAHPARHRIAYWRHNWRAAEGEKLSITQWKSLPATHKKYYQPVTDVNFTPVSYVRARSPEMKVRTNARATVPLLDEEQAPDKNSFWQDPTGRRVAWVTNVDATNRLVTVEHVLDFDWLQSRPGAKILHVAYETDEAQFWEPVTLDTHWREENQRRRRVQLVDPRDVGDVERYVALALSQP